MPVPHAAVLLGVATTLTTMVVGMGVSAAPLGVSTVVGSAPAVIESPRSGTETGTTADVAPTTTPSGAPDVPRALAVDFGAGELLPAEAGTYDAPAVGSPLRVAGGFLAHGRARGVGALSFAEVRLPAKVTEIGARIRFAEQNPGSAALVVWRTSFVKAASQGRPTPETGMRLVISRGAWELSVVPDDVTVLASGTFADRAEVTVRLLRQGKHLTVVDPDGELTTVRNAAAATAAGPWASWGLTETGPDQNPSAFSAIWAG